MQNLLNQTKNKYDYYSLLIKSLIFQQVQETDIIEIRKRIQAIKSSQIANGSWENTVFATVYHIEKLLDLGVTCDDSDIEKGIMFLFQNLNLKWTGLLSSGKTYGFRLLMFFQRRIGILNLKLQKNSTQKLIRN